MPPKSNVRALKKKKKITIKPTRTQNPSSSSSSNPPPASFFLDDYYDSDDFNDPFDLNPFGFPNPLALFEDFDDFTNPFHPSYHDSDDFTDLYEDYDDFCNSLYLLHHNDGKKNKKASTFKVIDDLDAFIGEGGDTTTQALLNLPLGIFLDILSRLSIKPLAICRCVCKTWGTLIHHPHFTKLHHLKATQNPFAETSILFHISVNSTSERRGTVFRPTFCEIFLLEHEKGDNFDKGVMVNPQFMPPKVVSLCPDFRFDVIGSCNGLLCLREPFQIDPIYVCNPVIGEYMTLPSCSKERRSEIVSGIGFDQVANEYKVVRMIQEMSEGSATMEAEVYTLGSSKWRNLGEFSYPFIRGSSQAFVNGALHWMATEYDPSQPIVAFDVGKEEFRVVSPPPLNFNPVTQGSESSVLLGELGGKLCLFGNTSNNWCQVWVMKEYGVNDSWTIVYVISREVSNLTGVRLKPVKLMDNGNILLVADSKSLVCYNPKRKRFHKLKIPLPPRFDAITHIGSFISLKDFVAPTDGKKHNSNTGGWYGVIKSVSSHNPEFDTDNWKFNEQMRQLWLESLY